MDFERAVVHVSSLILIEEETMVIHGIGATIDMREEGDIFPWTVFLGLHPEEIGRHNIEVLGVEVHKRF